ncbi:MAG: hypothetical protein JXA28_09925, partial [Bacteroidetes bacterium]|nr:hypothetical protein [Bacteroidota bacterium]
MWDIWLVDPGKHRDGAEHCAAIARASDAERILLIGSGDNPQLTFYFGGADIGWVEEDYLRYERLEPHALGADAIRARASGYADSLRVLLLIEHDEIMRGVSRRAEDLMPENFSIRLRTVRYSIATPPGVRLP